VLSPQTFTFAALAPKARGLAFGARAAFLFFYKLMIKFCINMFIVILICALSAYAVLALVRRIFAAQ
jgi:hypothetical protein